MLDNWLDAFRLAAGLVTLTWFVALLNLLTGYSLNHLGIYPRDPASLTFLPVWVLLHGDTRHLLINTTPLFYMAFFVGLNGPRLFLKITLVVTLVGGLAVWLVGRPAIHIGSSGLIFGYFGFLLAIALYERSLLDLAVASLTLFYYGGLFLGLVPGEPAVSYEAHLFGLCAGVLCARLFGREWIAAQGKSSSQDQKR